LRIAVIGGGIVGLSIGLACLDKRIGQVKIFEKESAPGTHASSRNSGVLHSGIYYDSDSLKARFSVQGNEDLRRLCYDSGIPILETGKLIVSQNAESENYLGRLIERSIANGVEAERRPKKELSEFEKNAITHESFVFVKRTAVSDPIKVFAELRKRFEVGGGAWATSSHVSAVGDYEGQKPVVNGEKFDMVVNAAGAHSVSLAKSMGVGTDFYTTPFLGLYWGVDSSSLPVQIPIYPTPHPVNPFLGVHLTPTLKGLTKIGPTAIPVLGKEQYSLTRGFKWSDLLESGAALTRVGLGSRHSLTKMVSNELPKFVRAFMVSEAAKLHSSVASVKGWRPLPGGIRAQLVHRNGALVQDFIVERQGNVVHVLNAVSPGWTSALPFGRWVVENYVQSQRGE